MDKPKRKTIAVDWKTHERLKAAAGNAFKLQGFTDELINNALDMRERVSAKMVTK